MSKTTLRIGLLLSFLFMTVALGVTGCDTAEDCVGEACDNTALTEGDDDPLSGSCGIQCAKIHETCQLAPGDGPSVCTVVCDDETFDEDERECVSANPCNDDAVHICLEQLPPL